MRERSPVVEKASRPRPHGRGQCRRNIGPVRGGPCHDGARRSPGANPACQRRADIARLWLLLERDLPLLKTACAKALRVLNEKGGVG
jgi:hypothetical protein